MKRTLSIILTALMLVTMLTTFSFAEEKPLTGGYDEEYGTITWVYDSETLTVSGTGELRNNGLPYGAKKVIINEGITSIADGTFVGGDGASEGLPGVGYRLEEIQLPETLESIGNAFSYSTVKSINIPKNVSFIGEYIFRSWSPESITVAAENTNYKTEDNCLYSYDMSRLIYCFDKSVSEYAVPENVEEIGHYAFCFSDLARVTFPTTLKKIGSSAFAWTCIESVQLNEGLKEIYSYAFRSCNKLESVTLPDGIEYIGQDVFDETKAVLNGYIGNYLVTVCNIDSDEAEIKDGTVLIAENVYEKFNVDTLIIPASVKIICDRTEPLLTRPDGELYSADIIFLGTWKEWDALGFPAKDVSCVTPDYKYTDVEADKWYTSAVDYCYELGYLKGMSETQFGVDTDITRGMFITVLARMAGVDTNANDVETKFADVAKNRYYTNAIKWANENGVVAGMSKTEFAPDAPIERQQLCVMLVNYAELMEKEIAAYEDKISFEDSGDIFDYAKTAVEVCQRADIINGYDENGKVTFRPTATAKRTEAAQILFKFAYQFM